MQKAQCRWAKSLGKLEGTHQQAWGTVNYTNRTKSCVFFGLYDLRDYIALWRHKGKAWVLWAGSDLRNLDNGFIFNDGKLKWLSKIMPGFKFLLRCILKRAEHWVENKVEKDVLLKFGIVPNVCPSYLGETNVKLSYKWSKSPHVYISSGQNRQREYGFDIIERIAPKLPHITFHLYGAKWLTKRPNIIVHGRISKDQMNKQIKKMQCGLSFNKFSGFSEITAKAVLWGQYAITRFYNAFVFEANTDKEIITCLEKLNKFTKPNEAGRIYYKNRLNTFPWNDKKLFY